jgi:hypothetical protein
MWYWNFIFSDQTHTSFYTAGLLLVNWETFSCSKIPCHLWNMTLYYRVNKSWPLVPIMRKINSFHTLISFLKIRWNIVLLRTHRYSKRVLTFWVSNRQPIWNFHSFLACCIPTVSFFSIWSVCKNSKSYKTPYCMFISGLLHINTRSSKSTAILFWWNSISVICSFSVKRLRCYLQNSLLRVKFTFMAFQNSHLLPLFYKVYYPAVSPSISLSPIATMKQMDTAYVKVGLRAWPLSDLRERISIQSLWLKRSIAELARFGCVHPLNYSRIYTNSIHKPLPLLD